VLIPMSKRVLVVDDEPNISLSLQFLMTQAGYEVRVAADGEAALQEVEINPPDLILLDVNMPKRSGFEVCETIRANASWAKIPILMLTAKGRDIEREQGLALGADDYFTKPFSTQEIVAKVKAMLGDS
jgi:two-component system alkaline phosphatase synthesis response regulator PhoP